ncbi:hypothetical protein ACRAWF_12155 [Streptomyces sp. L7]
MKDATSGCTWRRGASKPSAARCRRASASPAACAWAAAGRPLASGDDTDPVPVVRPVTPVVRPDLWSGMEDVAAISRGERPGTLVCALPPGGYDGSAPTRYSRRGHIPGSRAVPRTRPARRHRTHTARTRTRRQDRSRPRHRRLAGRPLLRRRDLGGGRRTRAHPARPYGRLRLRRFTGGVVQGPCPATGVGRLNAVAWPRLVSLPRRLRAPAASPAPDRGPSVRVRLYTCCYQHITAVSPDLHVEYRRTRTK